MVGGVNRFGNPLFAGGVSSVVCNSFFVLVLVYSSVLRREGGDERVLLRGSGEVVQCSSCVKVAVLVLVFKIFSDSRFVCFRFWCASSVHGAHFFFLLTDLFTMLYVLSCNVKGFLRCLCFGRGRKGLCGVACTVRGRAGSIVVVKSSQTVRRCGPSVVSSSLGLSYCGTKCSNRNVLCRRTVLGAVLRECAPGVVVLSMGGCRLSVGRTSCSLLSVLGPCMTGRPVLGRAIGRGNGFRECGFLSRVCPCGSLFTHVVVKGLGFSAGSIDRGNFATRAKV